MKLSDAPLKHSGEALKLWGVPLKLSGEALKLSGAPLKLWGEALKLSDAPLKLWGEALKLWGAPSYSFNAYSHDNFGIYKPFYAVCKEVVGIFEVILPICGGAGGASKLIFGFDKAKIKANSSNIGPPNL